MLNGELTEKEIALVSDAVKAAKQSVLERTGAGTYERGWAIEALRELLLCLETTIPDEES